MSDIYTHNQDEVTCPYCGWTDRDSWEFNCDEEYVEYTCGRCERDFEAIRNIEITYSSRKMMTREEAEAEARRRNEGK